MIHHTNREKSVLSQLGLFKWQMWIENTILDFRERFFDDVRGLSTNDFDDVYKSKVDSLDYDKQESSHAVAKQFLIYEDGNLVLDKYGLPIVNDDGTTGPSEKITEAVNNLTTTEKGYSIDARQGAEILRLIGLRVDFESYNQDLLTLATKDSLNIEEQQRINSIKDLDLKIQYLIKSKLENIEDKYTEDNVQDIDENYLYTEDLELVFDEFNCKISVLEFSESLPIGILVDNNGEYILDFNNELITI